MSVPRLPPGLTVIVRGWLHGNVVVLAGDRPALFDTGYCTGAAETIRLLESTTGAPAEALEAIYLTHVHSDHAGGCAALRDRAPGCVIHGHRRCQELAASWDQRGLWLDGTGQEMPRFGIDRVLEPGDELEAGGLRWQVVELPGHATGGLGFFNDRWRLLVGGDALWRDGVGALRPQVDGGQVFSEALLALERIEALGAEVVIPGHGEPFSDVGAALERARRRVVSWRDDPEAHKQSLLRGLVAFWVLGHEGAASTALEGIVTALMSHLGDADHGTDDRWLHTMWSQLEASGVVRREGDRVYPGARILEATPDRR